MVDEFGIDSHIQDDTLFEEKKEEKPVEKKIDKTGGDSERKSEANTSTGSSG